VDPEVGGETRAATDVDGALRFAAGALPEVLAALNHPVRLRVIAALRRERKYVSALARELRISRPLLYLHLEHLEKVGIVTGSLELSEQGKAVKWYALRPFDVHITPDVVAAAVAELDMPDPADQTPDKDEDHD